MSLGILLFPVSVDGGETQEVLDTCYNETVFYCPLVAVLGCAFQEVFTSRKIVMQKNWVHDL